MPPNPIRRRAGRIRLALAKLYPETQTALNHASPLQLLVATILSAQCTDVRVNLVTPALFARFADAAAFATAEPPKSKNSSNRPASSATRQNTFRSVAGSWSGSSMAKCRMRLDELVQLPGIGRKTANVVLGDAFGIPGITVDTHVGRLSRRLGLTTFLDPVKVERDLMALIPRTEWTSFSHRLIFHGRRVCFARKPNCAGCTLESVLSQNRSQTEMNTILDRFCRYVCVDTQAVEDAGVYPSSPGQLVLGKMLVGELQEIGLQDAEQDEHGIIMATIPATAKARCRP